MKELKRITVVRSVKVPSFSVLAGNGDTFFAGPAWKDANAQYKCAADTIRYPVHFVPAGYRLPNLLDIKPRFPQPPSTNQDDLYLAMDAVCEQSPATHEASTEAPAAKRR